MSKDSELKSEYADAYNLASGSWSSFINAADRDMRFYINDQWTQSEIKWLTDNDRSPYVFNRLKRIGHAVSGWERRNRLQLDMSPIGFEDDKASSQMTGLVMHAMNSANGYDVMSDAFEFGSIMSGANLVEAFLDRNGDINYARIPHNSFLLDPSFKKKDLSDCGFICTGKYITKAQANMLLPGKEKMIKDLRGGNGSVNRWADMPALTRGWDSDLLLHEAYWKRVIIKAVFIADLATGRTQRSFKSKRKTNESVAQANEQRQANGLPGFQVFDKFIDTVTMSTFLEGELIFSGEDPNRIGDYPFTPYLGYYIPESDDDERRLQGLLRADIDPQKADNKRINQMIDIPETQIQSGFKYIENSLVDEDSVYQSGQKKVIAIKDDAPNGMASVEQLRAAEMPASIPLVHQMLGELITEIPGFNAEVFGDANREVSSLVVRLRQNAGLNNFQDLIDNAKFAKKLIGRKTARIIQENYSPKKIKRILNEDPVPEMLNNDFMKFDCLPKEAIITDSQREMFFIQLSELKSQGAPIPWSVILKHAPLTMKDELIEATAAEEKRLAEQQAQESKIAQQQAQVEMAKAQAQIQADLGRARERNSQTVENETNSALNRAKTVSEIQETNVKTAKAAAEALAIVKGPNGSTEQRTV
jgi:hypothetical protein